MALRDAYFVDGRITTVYDCLSGVGDESVPVNPRIIQVVMAFVDGYLLDVLGGDQMDAIMPGWSAATTSARPSRLISGAVVEARHGDGLLLAELVGHRDAHGI